MRNNAKNNPAAMLTARKEDTVCRIRYGTLTSLRTGEELASGTHADLMDLVVGYGLRIETHMMGRLVVARPGGVK